MKIKRFVSAIIMALIVVAASAENNYKVTSSSRLNVRKSPSTSAAVLGTFSSGQQIEVISISKGWAKVKYNGKTGYVSEKYISPLPKPEPKKPEPKKEMPQEEKTFIQSQPEKERFREIKSAGEYEVDTPLSFGHGLSDNITCVS